MDRRYAKGLPLKENVDFVHINENSKNLKKELKVKFEFAKKIATEKKIIISSKKDIIFF